MTPPVLLALGPQIDHPGSLPNTLLAKLARSAITRQHAGVLHTAGVPVRVLTEDGPTDWPHGAEVTAGSCAHPADDWGYLRRHRRLRRGSIAKALDLLTT